MLDKLHDGWALFLASWRVLKADRELLVLPVLSGLACLAVVASFVVGAPELRHLSPEQGLPWPVMAAGALFYFFTFFVVIFFNSALVAAAEERFAGGDPTVRSALAAAWSCVGLIVAYAAIAASVGLLLRFMEQRMGGIAGKLLAASLGITWAAVTFLVVPILVNQHVGPIDAIGQSAKLLKKTWGQQLAGVAGMGVVFTVLSMAVVLACVLGMMLAFGISKPAGLFVAGLGILACVLLGVVQAALNGIYQAALYRFAQTGQVPDGFDQDQMEGAFRT